MLRESILKEFSTWNIEKQIAEYQAYKAMGDFSPFTETDYKIMKMIIENPNLEIEVECENGTCFINSKKDKKINSLNIKLDEKKSDFDINYFKYNNKKIQENLRLIEFIDTLYMLNKNNTLNENTIDKLKDIIIDMVGKIADLNILNKIKNILEMIGTGELTKLINDLQDKKNFSNNDIKNFKAIILETTASIEEKKDFINKLISENYSITKNDIINFKNKKPLYELIHKEISTMKIFQETYLDFLHTKLDNFTATGIGEFFLVLFGKNVQLKKKNAKFGGDLILDGLKLEIKGLRAKLQSQNGFGLSTSAWRYLIKQVTKFRKQAEQKGIQVPDINDPNNFNLKRGSKFNLLFKFLNEIKENGISNQDGFEHLGIAFTEIFEQADKQEIINEIFKPSINKNTNLFDINELNKNFVIYNMKYYQNLEKFSGILFINYSKKNCPAIYIDDSESFRNLITNFNYSGFSWKDNRSNLHRITLK